MTSRTTESTTRYRIIVLAISAVIVLAGAWQLRDAPIDIYPEYDPTMVVIQTEAVGLSAAEVERLVAVPLEELLAPTPLLEEIRSDSVPGLSVIELEFQSGVESLVARQLVQESLGSVFTLPNVTKPPVMIQPLSATNRVMTIGLTSDELSLIELSVLARWNITPKLLGVQGVANVAVWGQRERQLQVQIDPELMQAQDVSLDQVVSTTGDALWVSTLSFLNASVPGTGGWIDTPTQRLGIRHVLPISSPEDLANVSVDGTTLSLGDIASIVEGHPPIIGDAFIDGESALLLVIEKFPATSTLAVTQGVQDAMRELQPGLSGVNVDTGLFQAARFIESAQDNLVLAGWTGALLALLGIAFAVRNLRAASLAISAALVSVAAAGLILLRMEATLNVMVVVGLAVATSAIIADAFITAYSIASRPGSGDGGDESIGAALLNSRSTVVFGSLIGATVLLPVFFLDGSAGSFYRPLATAYAVGVGASLVVAVVLIPVLVTVLKPHARTQERTSRMTESVRAVVMKGSAAMAGSRSLATIAMVGLIGVALAAGLSASDEIGAMPDFAERDLRIQLESTPGTSPTAMTRAMVEISDAVGAVPGVAGVSGHVGRAARGDQTVGTNAGQLWVQMDPTADYASTLAAIEASLDFEAGMAGHIEPYLTGQRFDSSDGTHDLTVRVYGPELDVLGGVASEVAAGLASIEGLTGVRVDTQPEERQVEIEVDLSLARVHGIKPGDVRRSAAIYFAGIPVGNLFEEQKVFEVAVWSKPEFRGSLETLVEVPVDKPDGTWVRLGDVADVRVEAIPTLIKHEGASLYLDVVASVGNRNIDAVVEDTHRFLGTIDFPLEYNPQVRALAVERRAERAQFIALTVSALVGILLLLNLGLRTWRKAFLGLVAVPAALSGGLAVAAWLGDGALSLGALAGLLAVFGVAIRSTFLMISHLRDLEANEGVTFGTELVVRGASERLWAIVLTLALPGLALLPASLLGGRAGLEAASTIGIVYLGGAFTTLLVQVFLLPALYNVVERTGNVGTDLGLEAA
ncbi:MAG: efflux RND transporter permease subunit [Acidimicrobiia bacterium]|nr:efflux RND transporter permease subunit [Acidimicrobiia bacterium]